MQALSPKSSTTQNQTRRLKGSPSRWLWVSFLLLPSFALASGGRVNYRPKWSQKNVSSYSANNSFMADTVTNIREQERREFEESLMDPGRARELRQAYEEMEQRREYRALHDLSPRSKWDLPEVQDQERRDLSKKVVLTVGRHQGMTNLKKARQAAEKDPNIQKVKKPIAIVIGAYALYTGEPFDLRIADNAKIVGRTEFAKKEGNIGLRSSYINATAEMKGDVEPTPTPRPYKQGADERYRLSLSREIPGIDIESDVSYGTTTRTMSASVSRGVLIDHLTCTLEGVRPIGNSNYADNRVRFNYNLRF